ncbi:Arc family DNA-binding protein [Sinorhizobium medicae]|nr:Arc family DNA-binding protein [Sinorhizobium medicae]MDX0900657.1 Arc family DNA-binding protein [Sinorhizobium medicae]MDX0955651.1 Arc family DNA-binding protein [Sinorhizobium medicae]
MAREKYPSDKQDQFMVRLPEGMRDRIKKAAERSGRSMNAEIVAALETYYPPEPSIYEVLDRVHKAIELAQNAQLTPYRKELIEALDQFSEQISSGMEPDQFQQPLIGPEYQSGGRFVDRYRRWERAKKFGVETEDFARELERGMFSRLPGDRILLFIKWFNEGRAEEVLKNLRLSETKFVDKHAVLEILRNHLERFYRENWGDPNDPPPWEDEEF